MKKTLFALAAAAATAGAPALAQDFDAQLKARQGQFRIMAINLGILGAMAKGEVEYDAGAAQAAADSLAAVTTVSQGPLWPAGSDNFNLEGQTRALPSIWYDNADFVEKWDALGEAAVAMQAAAGEGQAAIGPALAQVGQTCQACHEAHRESN